MAVDEAEAERLKEARAYHIHGTHPRPAAEKLTAAERARREENRERRTARCFNCGSERDPRSFPLCPRCCRAGSQ
jgi:hypothetical protein